MIFKLEPDQLNDATQGKHIFDLSLIEASSGQGIELFLLT